MGISSVLLVRAQTSLGECWLVPASLSWMQSLDCQSELDVAANLLIIMVCTPLMPMLISSPINTYMFLLEACDTSVKRISSDENCLPNPQL